MWSDDEREGSWSDFEPRSDDELLPKRPQVVASWQSRGRWLRAGVGALLLVASAVGCGVLWRPESRPAGSLRNTSVDDSIEEFSLSDITSPISDWVNSITGHGQKAADSAGDLSEKAKKAADHLKKSADVDEELENSDIDTDSGDFLKKDITKGATLEVSAAKGVLNKTKIEGTVDSLKDSAEQAVKSAKKAAKEAVDESGVKDAVSTLRDQVESARDQVESAKDAAKGAAKKGAEKGAEIAKGAAKKGAEKGSELAASVADKVGESDTVDAAKKSAKAAKDAAEKTPKKSVEEKAEKEAGDDFKSFA